MSEQGYSKRPGWHNPQVVVFEFDGFTQAVHRDHAPEVEHRIKRYVASDDMLAALIHVIGCIENGDGDMEGPVRDAIAKAEGRQP